MKSLRELYKTGRGPSSSHTIGPEIIARNALARFGQRRYRVELFGSLALTGRGHGTDRVLREVLGADTDIVFNSTATDIRFRLKARPNFFLTRCLSAAAAFLSTGTSLPIRVRYTRSAILPRCAHLPTGGE